MTKMAQKALPATLLTLLATPAFADSSIFNLSLQDLLKIEIVSAAGYAQPATQAPATLSVLHAEQWQARGARTLIDAINMMPGVHIDKTQSGIAKNKVVLRGISGSFGEKVLILMDGKPFRAIRDGGVLFGQRIPLTGFKRIEVLKGPASAIYGADAMGGIINLISYEPGESPSNIMVRYGDFDTTDVAMQHHFDLCESTFQVAFDYQHSNDDPHKMVEYDLQSTLDEALGSNASNAPGRFDEHYEMYALKAQWTLGRVQFDLYDWNNLESGVSAGVAQALDPTGYTKQHSSHYNLNVDLSPNSDTQTNLHLSYTRQKLSSSLKVFPDNTLLPIGSDGNVNFANPVNLVTFTDGFRGNPGDQNYQYAASVVQNLKLNDDHHIRWEAGLQHDKTHAVETKNFGPSILDEGQFSVVDGTLTDVTDTPFIYLPDAERDIYFLSLQDEWTVTQTLRATLGVRYDHFSDFGDTTNPRLSLIWSPTDTLSFKLFAGSAFRAPSFINLYSQNNPTALGNPDLGPEKIQTLDTGLALHYFSDSNLTLDLSLFQYKAENLIEFVADTSGILTAQNVEEQNGKGLEFSGKWQADNQLSVDFNYSYLDSTDKNDVPTANIPKHMANVSTHWNPTAKVHLYIGAKWVADRARALSDTRNPIDDYIWATAKAEYQFNNAAISISAYNLLDTDARQPSNGQVRNDYPMAGRQLMMALRYRF